MTHFLHFMTYTSSALDKDLGLAFVGKCLVLDALGLLEAIP